VSRPGDASSITLVAAERVEEERRGLIRWLRPAFQNPTGRPAVMQWDLDLDLPAAKAAKAKPAKKQPWPKSLAEQARAVRAALAGAAGPVTASELARTFAGVRADKVGELLETLASLGQARPADGGRFAA
jgi:hypothetical protein